jgi:hypothetical protein
MSTRPTRQLAGHPGTSRIPSSSLAERSSSGFVGCGSMASRTIPWITACGKKYFTPIASAREHGDLGRAVLNELEFSSRFEP